MPVTTTSTTTSASAISSCHAKLYDIPTHDAACAMPMKSNYSAIMSSCCSSASVIEYEGCDYYCLAQGQTVGELAECLIKASEPGTGVATLSATSTGADSTSSATSSGATASSTANGAGAVVPRSLSKSAIGMIGLLFAGSVVGHFI
ncbi:hypothetical protein PoHVEF18_008710 [Penicillium ochrochloron]